MSSGSLGQGLSVGVGMALAARLLSKSYRVFVLLGDGECQEGQIWEAAMAGSHYRLDRLIAIVDYNKVQVNDSIERSMALEPLAEKWRDFGWSVSEVDGHSVADIDVALNAAVRVEQGPAVIIAHTVKGKGVSFMEGAAEWHSNRLSEEQYAQAMSELGVRISKRKRP
jgi:transketolase